MTEALRGARDEDEFQERVRNTFANVAREVLPDYVVEFRVRDPIEQNVVPVGDQIANGAAQNPDLHTEYRSTDAVMDEIKLRLDPDIQQVLQENF